MKTKTLLIILAIVVSMVGFASCTTEYQIEDTVGLIDVTEPDFIHVSSASLKKSNSLEKNPNNGTRTQLSALTEMAFNPIQVVYITSVTHAWLENEYERKQDVKNYYSELDSILMHMDTSRKERTGSVIYQVVARELNAQASRDADVKTMIINSDLREKSDLADFYDSTLLNAIARDFDSTVNSIIEKFEKAYPLSDLRGITVHLIYEPKTALESQRFNFTSTLYKRILEANGAEVIIGANLLTE